MAEFRGVRRSLNFEFLERIRRKKIAEGPQKTVGRQHPSAGLSKRRENCTSTPGVGGFGIARGEICADTVDGEVVCVTTLAVDAELATVSVRDRYGIDPGRQFDQRLNSPA